METPTSGGQWNYSAKIHYNYEITTTVSARETGLRQVTRIIRERQLRLYGHVSRLPPEDPAHRIFSCRDPSGWTMPKVRPQAS